MVSVTDVLSSARTLFVYGRVIVPLLTLSFLIPLAGFTLPLFDTLGEQRVPAVAADVVE